MKSNAALSVLLLATVSCVSGDAARRQIVMEMPAALESIEPSEIARARNRIGRNPMVIDGIQVTEHRRGWTRSESSDALFGLPEVAGEIETTPYRFIAGPWKAQCRQSESGTTVDTRGAGSITFTDRTDLKCVFANGPTQWNLEMKRPSHLNPLLTGDAMSGEEAILIRPVTARAGRLEIPGGWVFSIDRRPVAALQIAGGDEIRFASDAKPEERELVTALAAALLLYEP